MAERGDVLRLTRRLGFGARGDRGERVVVIQCSPLNASLPTLIVVPLDAADGPLAGQRFVTRVSASEAGADDACIAVATHIMTVRADRVAPGRVGHLRSTTMVALDEVLRLVLSL